MTADARTVPRNYHRSHATGDIVALFTERAAPGFPAGHLAQAGTCCQVAGDARRPCRWRSSTPPTPS